MRDEKVVIAQVDNGWIVKWYEKTKAEKKYYNKRGEVIEVREYDDYKSHEEAFIDVALMSKRVKELAVKP